MPLHWERIRPVVAKYASVYVVLTLLFAVVTGADAFAAIFGSRFLPHRTLVVITWVSLPASVIYISFLGYILVKVLTELARLAERER